jgi:histidine ammonia-lyase
VNPAISDLPAFLIKDSGLNSGFMIVQVAAAAIVSENKTLCHPASVDSIPTSADKEDHVSMGAWGARKSRRVMENARRVLSMELLAAAQGLDLLRPLKSSDVIEKAHRQIRKRVAKMDVDRSVHEDLKFLEEALASRAFESLVAEV